MAFQFAWIALGIAATLCLAALWPKKPFMANLRGKHVFLTGASCGIGLAIARQALREGAYLTLVARNGEKMLEVAKSLLKELDCPAERLLVKAADVGNYKAISTAVKESFDWRPIDVLINNAGLTRSGFMEEFSVEDINSVVQTNLLGSLYPLHAVLPQLKLRSRDHPISIVFVGSLASLCWLYGNGVYTGTKYALKGIAESLRLELIPYNMRVNLVCPGFVETALLNDVDNEEELTAGMRVASFYNRKYAQSPESVANILISGIKKGSFLITTTFGLGPILVILTRGYAPSDSFLWNLVEAILAGPARIISYFSQAEIYWSLRKIHRKHDHGS
jgi:3-dehydrosphinganine reductase